MRKSKPSKSDGDEHVSSENLQTVSNYEMQRLKRIEDNKKRMEALGLRKMANSFMGSVHKAHTNNKDRKGKRKIDDEDDEYYPAQDDEGASSSSEDNESDEEFSISHKKRGAVQRTIPSSDFVEDDDEALMQAVALSLQDTTNVAANDKRKEIPRSQNDLGKMRRKKPIGGRVKMSEDEMLVHFFQFDETGKGGFTLRDVQRLAMAHDFTWSEKELADMVHCFDSDGDGKITYDDFRKIVCGCNMLKGSDVGETG
ncbi:calmodulin-related [Striga hermonthica]|uniref:Calmodulin-related n=1 Tax=Striga hermonthica TaxID=68872 RepID=A0A9N7MH87_STRHE|nr:calmodulin-related [Striga hermonthica]